MFNKETDKITIMNFSGIYGREQFGEEEVSWMDVSDISGTNCYCDGEAFAALLWRIAEIPAGGIHFIDSGNYHYMSRIWLEKVTEPVTLIVFDNHTDMQPPAFGGLLSCGGWIAAAAEELEQVKEVILIGPDEEAFSQVDQELREKVKFLSREKLREMEDVEKVRFFKEAISSSEKFLYISVDKDILGPGEADTSWSQGDMKLTELVQMLKMILDSGKFFKRKLAGVDICGESEGKEEGNHAENIRANRAILDCLKGEFI